MARQNPKPTLDPLAAKFYERYVRFSEHLHNAWMHYAVQDELIRVIEEKCQDDGYRNNVCTQSLSPINSENRAPSRLRGENLLRFIKRLHFKETPESVLLNSVSLFEAFVCDIAKIAYLNDPEKYLLQSDTSANDNSANNKENLKLLRTLIKSGSREEAIEKYIDEKLRGVFYGTPTDIFTKNKLRFDLNKNHTQEWNDNIKIYAEVTARRNVIVHNLGKIDEKYLREVKEAVFCLGDIVAVDSNYLYRALHTLNTLAKRYVVAVTLFATGNGLPQIRMGI